MAEYEKETVVELRKELKEREIPSTGLKRKQQIIEKLEENDASHDKGEQENAMPTTEQENDFVDDNQNNGISSNIPQKRNVQQPSFVDPKRVRNEESHSDEPGRKPRLTSVDLEFDYDRSQLRDQRPTPGRERRPRYDSCELESDHEDLKAHFKNNFETPQVRRPNKKGRLSAIEKDKISKENGGLNPMDRFYDIYHCCEKGRQGSPTYDTAGFQIDYDKVKRLVQPQIVDRDSMVKGMDRAVEQGDKDRDAIFSIFFLEGQGPDKDYALLAEDYVKDKVSKDIGTPWHQIGPVQVKQWEERGYDRVSFKDWWREPTAEEYKRMTKMQCGSEFRKHLWDSTQAKNG